MVPAGITVPVMVGVSAGDPLQVLRLAWSAITGSGSIETVLVAEFIPQEPPLVVSVKVIVPDADRGAV